MCGYTSVPEDGRTCLCWFLCVCTDTNFTTKDKALSAVLLIFSFQLSLLFFHVGSQASDIGRCRKCGKYVPCTRHTAQGRDFEFDSNGKKETRHPVEGYFGSEFRAVCYHCVVMAA